MNWTREHLHGRVVALAIWRTAMCMASVSDGPHGRVTHEVPCDSEASAKASADSMLLEAYPHDCETEGCPDWSRFADP